jgi:hypothetical protein
VAGQTAGMAPGRGAMLVLARADADGKSTWGLTSRPVPSGLVQEQRRKQPSADPVHTTDPDGSNDEAPVLPMFRPDRRGLISATATAVTAQHACA